MRKYLLNTYNIVLNYSNTKWAIYALAIVAFTESSFFVIPPDFLLIPMALANPRRAFLYALIAGVFSVLGGIVGYILGYYFYEYIGVHLINYLHYEQQFHNLKDFYNKYDAMAIFIAGFTPIPYKLITLFSGFVKANFITFVIASILSRFGRFFLVAAIIYFFGNHAKNIIEKHIGKITIIFAIFIILIAYLIVIKG